MIAVAGGDGTVGKVARRLIGNPTPIAILPLGTANNIASTLGMSDLTLKDVIAGWKVARCVHFDSAVAKGRGARKILSRDLGWDCLPRRCSGSTIQREKIWRM